MTKAQDRSHPDEAAGEPNSGGRHDFRGDPMHRIRPCDPPEVALVRTTEGWRRFLPDYRDDWTHDSEGFPIISGWLMRNTTDLPPVASALGPFTRLANVRHGDGVGNWRPISDAYYTLAGYKPMDGETLDHLRAMLLPEVDRESEQDSRTS